MDLKPFTLDHLLPFLRKNNYNEPWHEKRVLETARHLPKATSPDAVYVDFGTHPLLLHAAARLGGYRQVWGASWDPTRAALPYYEAIIAEHEPEDLEFKYRVLNVNFEFDRVPIESGTVDTVSCLECIEHMTCDPMHLLIEINRILKDGGQLLLSTPNVNSWAGVLRAARMEHPMLYHWYFSGKYTNRHNLEYTPQQVRSMLRSAGFEGSVLTMDVWSEPNRAQVQKLIAAGFVDFDRGDNIVAVMKKAGPPIARYDPSVYALNEDQLKVNHRYELSYRNG